MSAVRAFCRSHPILIACAAFVVGYFGLQIIPQSQATYWGGVPSRLILSVIMLAIMAFIGGWAVIKPSTKGLGYAFKAGSYLLIVMFITGIIMLLPLFAGEQTLQSNWPFLLLGTIVFYLLVGLFEEAMSRGIIQDGFLARLGGTRSGIIIAVVLASLLFGVAHILGNLFAGGITDWETTLNALKRVYLTGAIGLYFGALYLKTRNIFAVGLIHGLVDIFVSTANGILDPAMTEEPNETIHNIINITTQLQPVLYIPAIVIAIVILMRLDVPDRGRLFTNKSSAEEPTTPAGKPPEESGKPA